MAWGSFARQQPYPKYEGRHLHHRKPWFSGLPLASTWPRGGKTGGRSTVEAHALTIMAAEQQTHDYYMNVGPLFSDPMARLLYAEIASIEEQHVTQYESIIDPHESWLEKWLLHEATEVCMKKAIERMGADPTVQTPCADAARFIRIRASVAGADGERCML